MLYVKFPVIGQPKKKTVYQLFTTLHETDQLLSIINLNMQRLHTLSMTSILKCSTIGSISSTKYLQQPCSTNYSWNISTHLLSLKLCFPQACLPVYSLRAIIMKSVNNSWTKNHNLFTWKGSILSDLYYSKMGSLSV